MSDTEDGSEPWFFSGDSPIKNWADEEDDENDDLDFNNSWLEEKERGEPASVGVHSDSRQGRTHGGGRATQMGPFNPARGGRGRRARGGGRGGNVGGGSAGGTPRAAGSGLQPATPPRGGNKKNPPNGRTPSPAKAKGRKAEGREDVPHAHPPATAATPPKRNGKREPKKKIAQKFVAVNRPSPHSDSAGSPTKAGLPVAALPREDNAYPPAAGGVEDGPTSSALELSLSDGGPPSYAEEAEVGIAHTLFPTVSDDFKSQMLLEMLPAADPAQSFIIFVRSNSTVIALAEQLDRLNLGTVALKEDDPVELITVYTDEFRMGKYRLLLIPEGIEAHTILSGLEHVTHAINYDVPDVDRYVARLGALRAEGDELIPHDVFTFITPLDEEAVLALEDVFGPLRRHIGSVSSSLQPQEEAHQHTHPTYQEHVDSREYLHHQQKAQRAAQQHRQRRQDKGKLNSPVKQTKPAKTKHLKQPAKTQKEVKGFLPNATRFNTGAAESWRASPGGSRSTGARTSVGGGDRWRA